MPIYTANKKIADLVIYCFSRDRAKNTQSNGTEKLI